MGKESRQGRVTKALDEGWNWHVEVESMNPIPEWSII